MQHDFEANSGKHSKKNGVWKILHMSKILIQFLWNLADHYAQTMFGCKYPLVVSTHYSPSNKLYKTLQSKYYEN